MILLQQVSDALQTKRILKDGDIDTSKTNRKKKPKTSKKKTRPFGWWNCKHAFYKDEGPCCASMHAACMNQWLETGLRKKDQPSIEEEEAIKARSAMQPKETRKKTRKKTGKQDVEQRGSGRGTRRNVENGMTQKDKKEYKKDLNGCTHGDRGSWQHNESTIYFCTKYRATKASGGEKNLDLNCIECGLPI